MKWQTKSSASKAVEQNTGVTATRNDAPKWSVVVDAIHLNAMSYGCSHSAQLPTTETNLCYIRRMKSRHTRNWRGFRNNEFGLPCHPILRQHDGLVASVSTHFGTSLYKLIWLKLLRLRAAKSREHSTASNAASSFPKNVRKQQITVLLLCDSIMDRSLELNLCWREFFLSPTVIFLQMCTCYRLRVRFVENVVPATVGRSLTDNAKVNTQ